MAPPFGTCEFDILFGKGISRSGDIVDLASEAKIIDKAGAWFSYEGERVGQGRDNAVRYLEEHPELLEKIEAKLFEVKGLKRNGVAAATDGDAPVPTKSKSNGDDKRPRARA